MGDHRPQRGSGTGAMAWRGLDLDKQVFGPPMRCVLTEHLKIDWPNDLLVTSGCLTYLPVPSVDICSWKAVNEILNRQAPGIPSIIASRLSVVDTRVSAFFHAIQERKKYEKIGAFGFCFGGSGNPPWSDRSLPVLSTSPLPLMAHFILALQSIDDMWFTPEKRLEAEAAFTQRKCKDTFVDYEFKDYKVFASRPDLKYPEIKEAFEEASDQAVGWFNKTLLVQGNKLIWNGSGSPAFLIENCGATMFTDRRLYIKNPTVQIRGTSATSARRGDAQIFKKFISLVSPVHGNRDGKSVRSTPWWHRKGLPHRFLALVNLGDALQFFFIRHAVLGLSPQFIRCITDKQQPRSPCQRCAREGVTCEYVAVSSDEEISPSQSSFAQGSGQPAGPIFVQPLSPESYARNKGRFPPPPAPEGPSMYGGYSGLATGPPGNPMIPFQQQQQQPGYPYPMPNNSANFPGNQFPPGGSTPYPGTIAPHVHYGPFPGPAGTVYPWSQPPARP
ncbi:hypothetical protein DFH07DRAFT_778107 [Mycena maculata]|uniref:Uncharacterized protein n=1 Tax=Mycena maculata TaxID=230809 RepID=A0AAD7IES3_9AGAR|nr:hypothetical protein DFH07DRAFT_778107 [Mycena maculata]